MPVQAFFVPVEEDKKTKKLMAHLGFPAPANAGYENVWRSVSQQPGLYSAAETPALRRAVLAHMFLCAHDNDAFLAFFNENRELMRALAAEIDALLKKQKTARTACKYANFIKLLVFLRVNAVGEEQGIKMPHTKKQLLNKGESRRAARMLRILVHYCQFVLDSDENAFIVKKVGRIDRRAFFQKQIRPCLPQKPKNVYDQEIKELFEQALDAPAATKRKAAALLCPSVQDVNDMLARHV